MNNQDIIDKFFEQVRNAFTWLGGETTKMAKATDKAQFDVDAAFTLQLVFLFLLLFGSACWAASIASARRHNPLPHFLLGFFLPWIYPLVILFTMDIEGERERRKKMQQAAQEKAEAEEQRKRDIAINSQNASGDAAPAAAEEEPTEGVDQARFRKLARNPDGSLAGPWDVVFNNIQVHVVYIIEALPQVVHVACLDEKGAVVQMRIPYAKIDFWNEAERTEADTAAIAARGVTAHNE
ncbi:MAG: hypothetical protein IJJ26_10230 [Victivallales bacterium]|nr:hypothetical protein [Victivallales bacterium]